MFIGDCEFVYKYTLCKGEIVVQEGEVSECGPHRYVQFAGRGEPVKCPRKKDFNRVWSDGKTLWMTDRNNEEAKKIFVAYGVGRILELQKEIDELSDMVATVRSFEFGGTSRCFNGESKDSNKSKSKPKKHNEKQAENKRQYMSAWDTSEFIDLKSYIERKIDMLKDEMCIPVSNDEVRHLKSLGSQSAVDTAVRTIINKYW